MLVPQSKTLILVTTLFVAYGRNRTLLGKVAKNGPCLEHVSFFVYIRDIWKLPLTRAGFLCHAVEVCSSFI